MFFCLRYLLSLNKLSCASSILFWDLSHVKEMAWEIKKQVLFAQTMLGGFMNQRKKLVRLLVAVLTLLIFISPAFANEITITGLVSNNMQIQTDDGTTYQIEEDDMGETLMVYAGKSVVVTGDVEEDGEKKTISVNKFKIVK